MYNFYRWYPKGKIIFLAPTKPLVIQQLTACFDVMGICEEDTVELTGKQRKDIRANLWKSKKVFFCTPQVVENDMNSNENGDFPFSSIKLIIFDEAHKVNNNNFFFF